MQTYSTDEVAKMIGVHKLTLIRWLLDGRVAEPRRVRIGKISSRIWAGRDVERVRKFKEKNYRKGRGRKAKSKR